MSEIKQVGMEELLEAMASGSLIIAWDTPIYRQLLINNKSGLLIEENNYTELANIIQAVGDNKHNYSSLGIG